MVSTFLRQNKIFENIDSENKKCLEVFNYLLIIIRMLLSVRNHPLIAFNKSYDITNSVSLISLIAQRD